MPSSNPTSGDPYTITDVRYEWTDLGVSSWAVFFTKADGTKWCLRVRGRDELAAYAEAIRQLDGAS